jgi:hypothetical protein
MGPIAVYSRFHAPRRLPVGWHVTCLVALTSTFVPLARRLLIA